MTNVHVSRNINVIQTYITKLSYKKLGFKVKITVYKGWVQEIDEEWKSQEELRNISVRFETNQVLNFHQEEGPISFFNFGEQILKTLLNFCIKYVVCF